MLSQDGPNASACRSIPAKLAPIRCVLLCLAAVPALVAACSHDGAQSSSVDASPPTDSSVPTADDAESDASSCAILFGNPNTATGLGPDQCRPECACGGSVFAPPGYSAAFIQSLVTAWELAAPYPPFTSDPYASPAPPADPAGTVCAVLAEGDAGQVPRPYALVTYPTEDAAHDAGAAVTHFGHCGVCSTLANLAVYMQQNDLTAPVRACGLATSTDGGNPDVTCLEQLGFDLPCAQAWAFDTENTRSVCLGVCLANVSAPYNVDGGALNPCLQCDEDQSGPVFQAVAGRTRRNSGLPNAICRPCSQVQPLVHDY